jgi:hypothetical protein
MGRGLIALASVALVLLVAGCGGGDSAPEASEASKAAFIKKADAICRRGYERMQDDLAPLFKNRQRALQILKHPSKADYEAVIDKVLIPNLSREVKEIRALGAPSGDEDRVEEILVAFEEGIETAENDPQAARNSSEAIFGIGKRLAGEYGLEVCSSR